jgi:hypothetical protein
MTAATAHTDGRRRRVRPEIQRLSQTTWFGTCATYIYHALRELAPIEAKLALCRDLQAFVRRQEAEIRRRNV